MVSTDQLGVEDPREFAERVNLPFSDYLLLSRALTHRSYLNEHPEALEDNERLEFLGDAVLPSSWRSLQPTLIWGAPSC